MVNSINKWRYVWFAALFALLLIGLAALSQPAFAQIASGVAGRTCSWVIDDNGVMTISPTNGISGTLPSTNSWTMWSWYNYRSQVKKVVVTSGVSAGEECCNLFYEFTACTQIDLSNLDTSNTTNMYRMFYNCSNLTDLDISGFNTSRVTDMAYMFCDCRSLTNLNVSEFNTSHVRNMHNMFCDCSSLTNLNVSEFNTSDVTNMCGMFHNCRGLTNLDVSGFDTANVTNMEDMFGFCSGLTSLDVSGFDTANVTNMKGMFMNCASLTGLNVSGWNTSKVTDMHDMFNGCKTLTNLDVSGFNTTNVTLMTKMFNSCDNLVSLDISNLDTNKVTRMDGMFSGCNKLAKVTLGENFSFKGKNITSSSKQALLPAPSGNGYTGKWIKEDLTAGPLKPATLRDQYAANAAAWAGAWVWEKAQTQYTLIFTAPADASGSMEQQKLNAAEDGVINPCTFKWFNHTFDHWVVTEIRADVTYEDGATIPANTYTAGQQITLNAVFRKNDNNIDLKNGEADLYLNANEKAYFNSFPSGTSYQVWEETPDGWTLVSQTNAAGDIVPLVTANAEFTNRYDPGTTSIQFTGTKIFDHAAAESGAFKFKLMEGDTVLQEITNTDAGMIQFDAISYLAPGDHTYTIVEDTSFMGTPIASRSADDIEWDTHVETITVSVTQDTSGDLHAVATYDDDGIVFTNTMKPGFLKIVKELVGETEANKDSTFMFRITLTNDKVGIDAGSEYYVSNGD